MQLEYSFPIDDDRELQEVESKQELQQILNKLSLLESVKNTFSVRLRLNKYMYACCRICSASLKFFWQEQSMLFKLKSKRIEHNHKSRSQKSNHLSIEIQNLMLKFPKSLTIGEAKTLVKHNLKVSEAQFYYYYNKIANFQQPYHAIIKDFVSKQYYVQTDPFNLESEELPYLLLISSPQMRDSYQRYSEIVSFDFTWNLFQDKSTRSNPFKLGIFTGLSSSRKIVPFCLVISDSQNKQTCYRLFKAFADMMGKHPNFYVTDEAPAFKQAIKELKQNNQFQGEHLFDLFHVLRNIKKKIKFKESFQYFSQLARITDQLEFRYKLDRLLDQIREEDLPAMKHFVEDAHHYCLSQVSPKFCGFAISTNINEKTHDIIKGHIPRSKRYGYVLKKTMNILQEMVVKCELCTLEKYPYEDLFGCQELKLLRFHLDKSVFRELIGQFSTLYYLQIFERQVRDFRYNLTFSINDSEDLTCQCQYPLKTGIPCSHLLKFMVYYSIPISSAINKRWYITYDKQKFNPPYRKVTISRLTRRRR